MGTPNGLVISDASRLGVNVNGLTSAVGLVLPHVIDARAGCFMRPNLVGRADIELFLIRACRSCHFRQPGFCFGGSNVARLVWCRRPGVDKSSSFVNLQTRPFGLVCGGR